jgi:hypothetical protein
LLRKPNALIKRVAAAGRERIKDSAAMTKLLR